MTNDSPYKSLPFCKPTASPPLKVLSVCQPVKTASTGNRIAGAVGLYLALTGTRLKTPEDLLYAGLGTHYVPSKRIPELRQRLTKPLQRKDKQQTLQETLDRIQPFTEEVSCSPLVLEKRLDCSPLVTVSPFDLVASSSNL